VKSRRKLRVQRGHQLSRRTFLSLAGLTTAALVQGATPLTLPAAQSASSLGTTDLDCDVVVIGAGLSGLVAASAGSGWRKDSYDTP
jgi:hypothetical protein